MSECKVCGSSDPRNSSHVVCDKLAALEKRVERLEASGTALLVCCWCGTDGMTREMAADHRCQGVLNLGPRVELQPNPPAQEPTPPPEQAAREAGAGVSVGPACPVSQRDGSGNPARVRRRRTIRGTDRKRTAAAGSERTVTMHYHLEIVMPPTEDVDGAVASIMRRFDENGDEDDRDHPFWDFYVVGGRWAGTKLLARFDQARIDAFYAWLKESKVTVSGFQAGKQEISPADQIPMVDAKWSEMFPEASGKCPLFNHSNDQYGRRGSGTIVGDICKLVEVPASMTCARVIFSVPGFVYDESTKTGDRDGPQEAGFMLVDSAWNGVNHMPVTWDGTLPDALAQYRKTLANMNPEYAAKVTPGDDWLAVTVDYHS